MDIQYMKTREVNTNDSIFVGSDFIAENTAIAVPYLVLIIIATVAGSVGNLMVIGSVLTYKPLMTVGNFFIVNLALADFCVTGFINPFSIVGVIHGEFWFEVRPTLCTTIGSVCTAACFTSLMSILAISINRYIHICHHQIYSIIYTKTKTTLMCISLWLFCIIVGIPNHFGWGDHKFDRKNLGCLWDRLHPSPYFYIAFALIVAIPATITLLSYYAIYKHVIESRKKVNVQTVAIKKMIKERSDSQKLAWTLCIIFIVFVACWTPHIVLSIADRGDVIPLPIHLYLTMAAHLNSSLNSIIYGLTNKQFRRAYVKLLHPRLCLTPEMENNLGISATNDDVYTIHVKPKIMENKMSGATSKHNESEL